MQNTVGHEYVVQVQEGKKRKDFIRLHLALCPQNEIGLQNDAISLVTVHVRCHHEIRALLFCQDEERAQHNLGGEQTIVTVQDGRWNANRKATQLLSSPHIEEMPERLGQGRGDTDDVRKPLVAKRARFLDRGLIRALLHIESKTKCRNGGRELCARAVPLEIQIDPKDVLEKRDDLEGVLAVNPNE